MKENENKNLDVHLVTVYTGDDLMEAELVKIALIDNGIQAAIDGEHQAGLTGILKIGILVREPDAKLAAEIIKEHEVHRAANLNEANESNATNGDQKS